MNGFKTVKALRRHGSDMVMVDNELYRVAADGVARLVSLKEGTPFAMVTHFDVDQTINSYIGENHA